MRRNKGRTARNWGLTFRPGFFYAIFGVTRGFMGVDRGFPQTSPAMITLPIPKGGLLAALLLFVASIVTAQNATTTGAASSKPPAATGSITGLVVDGEGKPVANVSIGYISKTERNAHAEAVYAVPATGVTPRVVQAAVANMTPEQRKAAAATQARIDPDGIYMGGTPAGKTDAKGAFTIKNLPADEYIVTARNSDESGSVQPVVVKAGAETKLPKPIKLYPMALGD